METKLHPDIIGGMFGIPGSLNSLKPSTNSDWLFLDKSGLFLSNARSGILILIDRLKPDQFWMPSFLCPTMLSAVSRSKTKLKFYEVDYNLMINIGGWIDEIKPNDLVLLIDYFGHPLPSTIAAAVKSMGAYILEDACQALLSKHVGRHADFVVYSPRKFVGVPDGGILISCCDVRLDSIQLEEIPAALWLKMLEASINRREYDQFGGDRLWYRLHKECESKPATGYFAMSELSRKLLFNAFDFPKIAASRIENYSFLLKELGDLAVFRYLPEDTVPLGFPIRLKNRDNLLEKLFNANIFPPVHWTIKKEVPKEFTGSHHLSKDIMTLLCDQRYSYESLNKMVSIIRKDLPCPVQS